MIQRDEIVRVAKLAKIQTSELEVDSLTTDCRAILNHFEEVSQLDVTNTAPAGSLEFEAPLREDIVDPDPLEVPLETNAPAWREGFFVLPRLPAHEDGAGDLED